MCLAQGPQRSDAGEARTRALRSRVKHSITEPLRSLYSIVTTQHFILKLISFPAKIWHVILHLVTPPLVVITAWILFGRAECMTSRSSDFKVHQIW